MKFKQLFIIALATLASTMFVACSSDDVDPEILPQEGKVNYFEKAIDFTSSGGSVSVCFSTNVNWTLNVSGTQGSTSWCEVSQSSGKSGSCSVVVTAKPNTDYDARSVVLTLTAKDLVKTIIVNQKKKDAIIIDKKSFVIGMDSVTFDVEVKSNVDYSINIPTEFQSWISQSKATRGLSTQKVSFTVAKSEEYDGREGVVYFKYGYLTETLKISQKGGAIIVALQNDYYIEGSETIIIVRLQSNIDYKVSTSDNWISEMSSRGLSSSSKSFKIAANKTGKSRTGKITFTTSDDEKSIDVTVTQEKAAEVKSLKINFTNTSGSLGDYLYIGKNYAFSVTPSPSNAEGEYEWSVENENIATISGNGNDATLTTKNFGNTNVVVTDKITGVKASYCIGTCVTNFQFTETSRESQYGYPVITIAIDGTHQLKYSCSPSYATKIFRDLRAFNFKELIASINTYAIVEKSSIVDIDENGLITPKKIGNTIIAANNGYGVSKSGSNDGVFVKVVEKINPYGTIGGYGYVDLALPSGKLWATQNFGGFSETDYGSYYLWSSSDKVPSSWGSKWATPTIDEYNELINYCKYEWTSKNGVSGYLFTGSNNATMFLPASGFNVYIEGYGMAGVQSKNKQLIYWSITKSSSSWEGQVFARALSGSSSSLSINTTYNTTMTAAPIRPISR